MMLRRLHPNRGDIVPREWGAGRSRWIAVLAVALVVGLTSCTSDEDPDAAPATSESAPPETAGTLRLDRPEARWDVKVEQVRGGVERSRRPAIAGGVQRSLATWVDGAFRGQYPRRDFSPGFAVWTKEAARLGRVDRSITTNAGLASDLDRMVADRLRARVYVFASGGVTGGATAKVDLRFTGVRTGGALVGIRVTGDVALTRDGARWRIFGYDLDRIVEGR